MEAIFVVCQCMKDGSLYGAPVAAFKSRSDANRQATLLEKNERQDFIVVELTLTYNVAEAGYFNTKQEARNARRV